MSIPLGGLRYLGVPVWQETSNSGLTLDFYGFDSLQRSYDVRPDQVDTFRAAFAAGTKDTIYPTLFSVGATMGHIRGVMCEAVVNFKGVISPPGKVSAIHQIHQTTQMGLQMLQTTIKAISNPQYKQNISYRAAFSQWDYVVPIGSQDPKPLYDGKLLQNDVSPTVISNSGDIGVFTVFPAVIPDGQAPPLDDVTGDFVGFLQVIPKDFKPVQVGSYWKITESNELIMVDAYTIVLNNLSQGVGIGAQQNNGGNGGRNPAFN